jgi:hypothetical protein
MAFQPKPDGYYQDEKVNECAGEYFKYIQQLAPELRKLLNNKKLANDPVFTKKIAEIIHWLEKTVEYTNYLYKHPENPVQAEDAGLLKQKVEKEFLTIFDASKKFDTLTPPQTLFAAIERYNNGHPRHLLGILANMTDSHFKVSAWIDSWEKFNAYTKYKK